MERENDLGRTLIDTHRDILALLSYEETPKHHLHPTSQLIRNAPKKSKSGQNRDYFYVVLDPGKMPYSRIGDFPIAPKTRTNGLSSSWNIPDFVSRVIPGIKFRTERKMAILGSRYVPKNTFLTGRE